MLLKPPQQRLLKLPMLPRKKGKSKGDSAKTEPNTNDSGESATTASKHSPPTLGEDEFPTLQDKQVEWETPNELEGNGME